MAVRWLTTLGVLSRFIPSNIVNLLQTTQQSDSVRPNSPYYGQYMGILRNPESGIDGVVWLASETELQVSDFSFREPFLVKSNVSFWVGPSEIAGIQSQNLRVGTNGYYVKYRILDNDYQHYFKQPSVIVAKRPTQEQIASIVVGRGGSREKTEPPGSDEPKGQAEAEPEPGPGWVLKPESEPSSHPISTTAPHAIGIEPKPIPEEAPWFAEITSSQTLITKSRETGHFTFPTTPLPFIQPQQTTVLRRRQPFFPITTTKSPIISARPNFWQVHTKKPSPVTESLPVAELPPSVPIIIPPIASTNIQTSFHPRNGFKTDGNIIVSSNHMNPANFGFRLPTRVKGMEPTIRRTVQIINQPLSSLTHQLGGRSSIIIRKKRRCPIEPYEANPNNPESAAPEGEPQPEPSRRRRRSLAVVQNPISIVISDSENCSDGPVSTVRKEAVQTIPKSDSLITARNNSFDFQPKPDVETHVRLDSMYRQRLVLTLPKGKKITDFYWLAIYDHKANAPLSSIILPSNDLSKGPKPVILKGFKKALTKHVFSPTVEVLDSKTIVIRSFEFEGDAPGAWFMAGKTLYPSLSGHIIPIFNRTRSEKQYDCDFLSPYDGTEDITLKLPGRMQITDVFWLSVFCVPYSISFAHIYLPFADITVPPDLSKNQVPYCQLEPLGG